MWSMERDIQIVANDLNLYFKGFQVALKRRNLDDAIRYLKDIRRELNDNLDYLQAEQEASEVKNALKGILGETLKDYRLRAKRIEEEMTKF